MENRGQDSPNSIQTVACGTENASIKTETESPSKENTVGSAQIRDRCSESNFAQQNSDSESESSSLSQSESESEKSSEIESEESEDYKPLAKLKKVSKSKRPSNASNCKEEDSDEDIPLSKKKKLAKIRVSSKKLKIELSEEEYSTEKTSSKNNKKRKNRDSSEESQDSDYDDKCKPTKKKTKENEKKKVKSERGENIKKSAKKRQTKNEEDEQHIWKWWLEDNSDPSQKWHSLIHKGPLFAPPYEPLPSHVNFYYDSQPIKLSIQAEEIASFYAKMLDHDYTTKEVFNKNFFKDWRTYMTEEEREMITDLNKCDFRNMHQYFKEQSEKRKQMTKEQKAELKNKEEEIRQEHGYCIVDGHRQKIGNYKIEPPGLFRGRGEHPKMGKVKRRIEPEDVIINIGKKADAPQPPPGHKWKEVRVDKTVTWLASWTENIMGSVKYIMLNPSSKLKSMKDWQKFEKARELKQYVDQIRRDYREDFKARQMVKRQRAVALYLIDKLALRAGNEKEEGETADTVGCCSLRVEHINLHKEKDGQQYVIEFDFLGKDSIRYQNSVSVEKRVFKNFKLFMENKLPSDDLFDRLTTSSLNKYLNSLMEGLTAKVFRTYNASITLQDQLQKLTRSDMSPPEKILAHNRANRAVAVLCNHQRSIPKAFDKQMDNLNNKISDKKEQIRGLKKELKKAKEKEDTKEFEKLEKKMSTLKEQLKKLEVQLVDKDENKQIALGTSKLNYLDPRISVAWCKKYDVPIERIYNKTQREKFRWAIEMAGADFIF